MAKTLKPDLEVLGNPHLTLGVAGFDATSAIRSFIVKDMGGTDRENLRAAAEIYLEEEGGVLGADGIPVHPDYTANKDLPLSAVRVTPFANHVIGTASYRRGPYTLPRYQAFEFARESSYVGGKRVVRYFPEESYTVTGLDSLNPGQSTGWYPNTSYRWRKREFRRKQIVVTTKLLNHPEPRILDKSGKSSMEYVYGATNKTPFRINGVERPAGTLKFADMDIQPIDTINGRQWLVRYEFIYDSETFYDKTLLWLTAPCQYVSPAPNQDDDCSTSNYSRITLVKEAIITEPTKFFHSYYPDTGQVIGNYATVYKPLYFDLEFNGLFPVHDDLDGYKGLIDVKAYRPKGYKYLSGSLP